MGKRPSLDFGETAELAMNLESSMTVSGEDTQEVAQPVNLEKSKGTLGDRASKSPVQDSLRLSVIPESVEILEEQQERKFNDYLTFFGKPLKFLNQVQKRCDIYLNLFSNVHEKLTKERKFLSKCITIVELFEKNIEYCRDEDLSFNPPNGDGSPKPIEYWLST